ncbi:hypothetical protein QT350_26000 (plasmid) [Escherichia coli]|nr:hypothetical protein [Escherichia coli]MDM5035378.1 hypothetical protein [Escherichia coli]
MLILIACLIGGNYLGGYAALKYSGLSIDMLQWNTFNNVITQFSGKPEYKKLVAVTWAGFAAPCAIFIGFVVIVIVGLMPKKVIYGNARLATDMDLAKSTFFPTDKELKEARLKNSKPYCFPPILIGKHFKGRFKNKYIFLWATVFNPLCSYAFW